MNKGRPITASLLRRALRPGDKNGVDSKRPSERDEGIALFIFRLMKSKVLLGLAAVSLALAIASVVLLVRSFGNYDAIYYSNLERSHQLFTVPGSIVFSTWTHLPAERFEWDSESGKLGEVKLRLG